MPAHVRTGDFVMVTAGDHKGKTGEVIRVVPDSQRVFVKGVNVVKRHLRPTRLNPQGGVVTREASIHMSNVSPVVDGQATRVRFKVSDDGSKERVAVKGGKSLGKIRGPRKKG